MNKSKKQFLTPFEWFLILGVTASTLGYSFLTSSFDVLGIIASITGLIGVVLCAKGSIYNYFFGVINVALYAWISFTSQLYGTAAINALYYVPMNIIGWFSWKKQSQAEDESIVQARNMSGSQRIVLCVISIISVAIFGFILSKTGDAQPYTDSATTILSIIAMFLMVKAFTEQWLLWIALNVVSLAMWIILIIKGEGQAVMMVIMYIFYLTNSINGLIQWKKLSKDDTK